MDSARSSPGSSSRCSTPTGRERGALVGWLADRDREERVVAVGSYTRISGSKTAEMAFAVDDSEQGRGIGTRLLEQLAGRARDAGIDRFVAEVMASNEVRCRCSPTPASS